MPRTNCGLAQNITRSERKILRSAANESDGCRCTGAAELAMGVAVVRFGGSVERRSQDKTESWLSKRKMKG
jgi:hypothetical protein